MNILYLDFDGVLHDDAVYSSMKRGIFIKTPGRVLFEWLPILEELLAPHPDIRIVLSTSWVSVKGFNYAKRRLGYDLSKRVVGSTFHNAMADDFARMERWRQITRDVTQRKPSNWFAIDNEGDWPSSCSDHLVLTQDRTGLNELAVQEAVRERLHRIGGRNG